MTKTVSFANGGEIPVIGFGTWQFTGQTCVDAVRTAVRNPLLRSRRELMILRVAVVPRASFAFAAVKIVY